MTGEDPRLSTSIGPLRLRNPVMLAAGTAGDLDEIGDILDLSRIGAIVSKSVTPQPRAGHPGWRVRELAAGMLNAVGLANVGLEAFVRTLGSRIPQVPTAVLLSVAGFSVEDFVHVADRLAALPGVAGLELNLSCPNVSGGYEFGTDCGAIADVVSAVRRAIRPLPLLAKLPPLAVPTPACSIIDLARAALDAGADALTIANTIPALALDVETHRPRLANVSGGLSGPAIHPVAVKLVHDVRQALGPVPIVGAGGVMHWHDAAEFILAGASAVQIGTALFADPRAPLRVVRGLSHWIRRQGRAGVSELVGAAVQTPPAAPAAAPTHRHGR